MSFDHIKEVIKVVKKLRDPQEGCPWDLQQDHKSLLKYLIEESYEFVHAVEEGQTEMMKDELGDLLLQVLLHSQIAEESNSFDIYSVCQNLSEKLVRRHPHVFDESSKGRTIEEIKKTWEETKKEEKEGSYLFDESYLHMPALLSAYKIGKKTALHNFDWENYQQVIYKVEEEWQELKEELGPQETFNKERAQEELGDFLFSAAQLARHLGFDPEESLRMANKKFIRRFKKVEDKAKDKKKSLLDSTQEELEIFWSEVKHEEKSSL